MKEFDQIEFQKNPPRSELIDKIRYASLGSVERNNYFGGELAHFADKLKAEFASRVENIDTALRAIPIWHQLIGSTLEEHQVDPIFRAEVEQRISEFAEKFASEWGIAK